MTKVPRGYPLIIRRYYGEAAGLWYKQAAGDAVPPTENRDDPQRLLQSIASQ